MKVNVKLRIVLAASLGVVALFASACGVAAPESAASLDGRSIPASVVDALATDEAFAALLGFQVSQSDAVLDGSTARSVIDFLLQGEALAILAEDQGLDAEPDEAVLAQTIEGLKAQGYTFDVDDLSSEAIEVLSRFVVADRAVLEAGEGYGTITEADLRFAYEALEESGRWERTCVTMVGGPPELASDAMDAVGSGTPLAELPDEVEGIQLAIDAEVRCATGADLATLPGELAAEVDDAETGEMVGPIDVDGSNQPLAVIFTVTERSTLSFADASEELEAVVAPSLLAVRTARLAEVNPRYGGPVEVELVQGEANPTTGQQGPPSLVARVSRPQAPEAGQDALLGP
jgi:hypothetical protein